MDMWKKIFENGKLAIVRVHGDILDTDCCECVHVLWCWKLFSCTDWYVLKLTLPSGIHVAYMYGTVVFPDLNESTKHISCLIKSCLWYFDLERT